MLYIYDECNIFRIIKCTRLLYVYVYNTGTPHAVHADDENQLYRKSSYTRAHVYVVRIRVLGYYLIYHIYIYTRVSNPSTHLLCNINPGSILYRIYFRLPHLYRDSGIGFFSPQDTIMCLL